MTENTSSYLLTTAVLIFLAIVVIVTGYKTFQNDVKAAKEIGQLPAPSGSEFEFSGPMGRKGSGEVYILRDNVYEDEYIVVFGRDGVGVCPRQSH